MELLAPAGNAASLKAAVYSGAGAVYLGMDLFNARAKADNFTAENISEYIDFCHLHGVKVYIAFNTCVKDSEIDMLRSRVSAAADAGADAFIVTDIGALDIFRESKVPLHASTQMGIHNLEGALMAKQLGFRRVVLSRECRIEDIKSVKASGLEVEVFVHGALCVSFSGGCLMSSFMSGDSGNRGRCNQPCRREYTCGEGKGYLLSASDICRLNDLQRLEDAGVDSCKIEGRLKTPYYVAEAVSAYKDAMDGKRDKSALSRLKRAYNRGGFISGYDKGNSDIISYKIANNAGEEVGAIKKVGKGRIETDDIPDLAVGDGIKITRGGAEVCGMRVDKIEREGGRLIIPCLSSRLRAGDKISITYDIVRERELIGKRKYIPFDAAIEVAIGKKIALTLTSSNVGARVESEYIAQPALNRSITEGDIRAVMDKDNGELKCSSLSVELSENCFAPISVINDLRKSGIAKLKAEILNNYKVERVSYEAEDAARRIAESDSAERICGQVAVMSDDIDILSRCASSGMDGILKIRDFSSKNIDYIMKNGLIENNLRIYLAIPKILRVADMRIVKQAVDKLKDNIKGLYCDNIGAVYLAKQYKLPAIGGTGLNIYNKKCMEQLGLEDYVASPELNAAEVNGLPNPIVYAYGRPAVMTLTHCPVKLNYKCGCDSCKWREEMKYGDSYGEYPIKRIRLADCYFELLNPDTVNIAGKHKAIVESGRYLLDMTGCDVGSANKVIDAYLKGEKYAGGSAGHLLRGVK
ncbi:MAG: U32 family peptidase [Clostridia bacterium]|nr:U32 family peptidase [Clostridia bacterium]